MENPLIFVLAVGVLLTNISVIGYFLIKIIRNFTSIPFENKFEALEKFIHTRYRELGLLFATVSTAGSLYMSNVLEWTPCRLCWFQRIFMYPLVILFGASLIFDDEKVSDYALPLSLIGLTIAGYHYLIQRISQFQAAGCSITQISCETKYTFYFGYVSVPMMAFTGFLAILLVSYYAYKNN